MRFLRSNTAVIVTVGPFYDKTDGVTIETALTITNEKITLTADTDAGSAPTNVLDNVTGATSGTANDLNYITGNDAGMMQLELAAADVNRVGRMFLSITDAANHVPVFHEFFVLPAVIYDWLTAGAAPLSPTTAGRTLDVTATGGAGIDWSNVEAPTTALALTGTTIAVTQKVDVETIKTNPVANAGTVTFPTNATLASTTNITAGTVTTATNVTTVNGLAADVITAASIAANAIGASEIADGAIDAATFAAGAIDATAIATDAIGSAEVAAGAVTKIQAGLATPTNITAGVITTVTNLTNAPTAGDLTATMKTSVTTAATAATPTVTAGTVSDKTGYAIGVGGIAATAFASGAIDAAAIATDAIGAAELAQGAAQEVADEVLDRNLAGGGSGNTRNVRNSLRALRNKVDIAAGTATIYAEDDTAAAWTAAITTTAGNPISTVDPA